MSRVLMLSFFLLAAIAVGCGEPDVPIEESDDPEQRVGEVDESLSKALQIKQQLLKIVLDAFTVENIEVEFLSNSYPRATFTESAEDFDENTLGVARWDFNGKPTGSDVPVALWLSVDSSGTNERKVERVYTVTGSMGAFKVARKKGG